LKVTSLSQEATEQAPTSAKAGPVWGDDRLEFDRKLISIFFMLAIALLLPLACGLRVSVSSNAGIVSEEIEGSDDDAVFGRTMVGGESLSHAIKGGGSLKASHRSATSAGAYTELGVDINEAERYYYSYELVRGAGLFWPDSRHPEIQAEQTLDVVNAASIEAFANAFNAKGDMDRRNKKVFDPDEKSTLTGYDNKAKVSGDKMAASEPKKGTSEEEIDIKSLSLVQKLLIDPYKPDFYDAAVRTRILSGSIDGFSYNASAWDGEAKLGRHINSTSVDGIGADSESAMWMGSLTNNLNRTIKAKGNKTIEGNLTGLNSSAEKFMD
jgi:hypothetical protein